VKILKRRVPLLFFYFCKHLKTRQFAGILGSTKSTHPFCQDKFCWQDKRNTEIDLHCFVFDDTFEVCSHNSSFRLVETPCSVSLKRVQWQMHQLFHCINFDGVGREIEILEDVVSRRGYLWTLRSPRTAPRFGLATLLSSYFFIMSNPNP